MKTLVWGSRVIGEREFACTEGSLEVGTASRICFSPKFLTVYSLITTMQCSSLISHGPHPCDACFSLAMAHTHAMLAFNWPWPTPTRCLPFIGHGPHPRDACLSLAMAHTHAMLALHWPCVTCMQCLFLESSYWFYLQPDVSINSIHQV